MRKFVIEVTSDTDDSLDFVKRDLQCEIGCCSNHFDVDSMTVKEIPDEEETIGIEQKRTLVEEFEKYVKNFKPCCTSDGVDLDMLKAVLAVLKK